MRIRQSRPPFPFPSPPDPLSRSRHLRGSLSSGEEDPFLVEDTSRLMGWSCYPLNNPACQAVEEGSRRELQQVVSQEANSINFEGKDNVTYHSIRENSSQVSGGKHGGQGNEAKDLFLPTASHEYVNASGTGVNFATTLPCPASQIGEGLQFKKRKLAYHSKRGLGKDAEEDEISVEKMETCNRTETIYCVMKCEFSIPSDDDRFGGDGVQEKMALEETGSRLKEVAGRGFKGSSESGGCNSFSFTEMLGRGHKGSNESEDFNSFTEFTVKQTKKRGRPRKIRDLTDDRTDGCMEMNKRMKGRPKKTKKEGQAKDGN